jgi:HK97 family phage major capsid protein
MLASVKLQKRQSEIRQELAGLAGKDNPEETELRAMESLDAEYQSNETRYRAALIAEDEERRDAGADLEIRSDREYSDLLSRFQLSQALEYLAEGVMPAGETREVLEERGGIKPDSLDLPWEAFALEQRAGETIASGVPDPIKTMGIVDQLFPASVASKMGVQSIQIPSGAVEWPLTTQGCTAGWQATELGDVGAPQAFQTTDKVMKPEHTYGVQMDLAHRARKQHGPALEQAVRRNSNAVIGAGTDQVVFLGTGATGEPLGIIPGAATYGIDSNTIDAAASYDAFRTAGVEFMVENAATSLSDINILMRPELINGLDGTFLETGSGITMWDIITRRFGSVVTSSNALDAPSGSPLESTAVMTTKVGGFPPAYVGFWGGVEAIRDPYTSASSGQLKLTFLITMDVTVVRPQQLRILTELQ